MLSSRYPIINIHTSISLHGEDYRKCELLFHLFNELTWVIYWNIFYEENERNRMNSSIHFYSFIIMSIFFPDTVSYSTHFHRRMAIQLTMITRETANLNILVGDLPNHRCSCSQECTLLLLTFYPDFFFDQKPRCIISISSDGVSDWHSHFLMVGIRIKPIYHGNKLPPRLTNSW